MCHESDCRVLSVYLCSCCSEGAHHSVDSCDYSFQLAAEGAIKQGSFLHHTVSQKTSHSVIVDIFAKY